jgi:hypothetical protein
VIRPMQAQDKPRVLEIIRATGMFTPAEVEVAEELIDIYLGSPDQRDYRIVVIESEGQEPSDT